MMPVQGKRRYVDEETGQLVEGTHIPHPLALRKEAKTYFNCGAADYDYIFADDEREANPTSFKFLQMAHAWAASKKAGDAGSGGGGGGALSRFTTARDADSDSRPSGAMDEDEDVASASSA